MVQTEPRTNTMLTMLKTHSICAHGLQFDHVMYSWHHGDMLVTKWLLYSW